MEKNKIYWKDAVMMLNSGTELNNVEIDFNNEQIEFKDVALLNRNGIRVPEEYIYYNDDEIDFSDDPDITDKDFETGKLVWNIKATLPIDKELSDWIKKEHVDVDKLLIKLMRDFYETIKDFPKKTAL